MTSCSLIDEGRNAKFHLVNIGGEFRPFERSCLFSLAENRTGAKLCSGLDFLESAIFIFGSEPFSTSMHMKMFPYGSERVAEARFGRAVELGILSNIAQGAGYQATQKGLHAAQEFIQAAEELLSVAQQIPLADMVRINGYLERICQASLTAPEPPLVFGSVQYFKNMHPGKAAPPMRLFVHYFATLDKYRGNSHLASWQHYGIEGNRWDVLPEVWEGTLNTLDLIYAELEGREIPREEYASILQDLEGRGWIKEVSGNYLTTEGGLKLRDEAEALTDRYFFTPWACLSEAEQAELSALADELNAGLEVTKLTSA